MAGCKENNKPIIYDYNFFNKSYLDILNKKKVLYKYVFLFNNYKFKFKIISTYYEYLIIYNNMLKDVSTCDLHFGPLLFFEMLGKSFYYPYLLYIYENDKPYYNISTNFNSIKFVKSSILDMESIIKKGKEKNNRYLKKKKHTDFNDCKNISNNIDIHSQLENYNLQNKNIVGYTELYLLFHMGRFFDSRVERLVVNKNYRNKSFGLLIMYISIYVLKYLYCCNRCDLTVENEIALKLYKKLKFVNIQTDVYRLYLHCNYNFITNSEKVQNDKDNIQMFIDSIMSKNGL
ncbi:N-acetyltransferase, putative [Hepatocystis sp. ex Piliocolobus tephrosceles]|nr:N-acetyltransferase, putative [Hepatocystis sp. ex Piliocolobus tephrosceles]